MDDQYSFREYLITDFNLDLKLFPNCPSFVTSFMAINLTPVTVLTTFFYFPAILWIRIYITLLF